MWNESMSPGGGKAGDGWATSRVRAVDTTMAFDYNDDRQRQRKYAGAAEH